MTGYFGPTSGIEEIGHGLDASPDKQRSKPHFWPRCLNSDLADMAFWKQLPMAHALTVVLLVAAMLAGCGNDDGLVVVEDPCSNNIIEPSSLTQDPVRVVFFPPAYPPQAIVDNWEGAATAGMVVNSDGSVCEVTITATSGRDDIDEAVLKSARQAIFEPGYVDSVAVRTRAEITVEFRLSNGPHVG